jgi:PAS domain S-box-containing protein
MSAARRRIVGGLHTLIFIAFVVAVAAIARTVYLQQRREFETQLTRELSEIAAQKARQIADWRQERLGDAEVVKHQTALMPALTRLLTSEPLDRDRPAIDRWLDALRRSYEYAAVTACDRTGAIKIVSGEPLGHGPSYSALGVRATTAPDVLFVEMPRGPDAARSHFVLAVPVADDRGDAIGAMALTVDPVRTSFSDILKWPRPTETGEILLVRRDDDPLVLNDVRGRPESSMEVRLSALAGESAVSARSDVERSTWTVVVRIRSAEAWAPFAGTRTRVVLVSVSLIAVAAVGLVLLRRQQRRVSDRLRRRYDRLARFVNDAIVLYDDQGRIVEANDRALAWYGYSKQELLQLTARDLRAPSFFEEFDRKWAELQRDSHLVSEGIARRKDGSEFPTETSSRTFEVDGRRFTQSVIRDISDRKHAAVRIARLNRLNAVLSQTGHATIHATGEQNLYDRVCRSAIEYGQFSLAWIGLPDAPTGRLRRIAAAGPAARAASGDQDAAERAFREGVPIVCADVQTTEGVRSSIALPLRREGRVVGVLTLCSSEPHFFDAEEAQLASDVAADLSFALEAIAHRERIERVLEAVDEGYWDWRLTTGELHLSARAYTMFGYEPDDPALTYDAWLATVHSDDRGRVIEALDAVSKASVRTIRAEFRVRHRSGHYVWVFGRGRIVEADGAPGQLRFVGTLTDITSQKTLEAQFLQSQKLETVGRLAGGVAHDFNNILTVINGYSDMLLGAGRADDPNRASLEAIQQAGERAAALTRQLLAFSRKHVSQPLATSVGGSVHEFVRMARRILPETVKLIIAPDAAEDYVVIDPTQLGQVLMNLVVNARDAMRQGGTVTVSTSIVAAPVQDGRLIDYVCLTVADTGTGMDAETRSRIFEPFFTTKEQGHGTGLGLWTVNGIVQQSDGFIRVESEAGAGSSFHIYLPRVPAPPHEPKVRRASFAALRGSETILVAEDQDEVRRFAVEALTSFGYRVLSAANGIEAVAVAERFEGTIDLLITDVVMPGMNGRDLAARLGARWPRLRCIFMSGYTDDMLGEHGIVDSSVVYCPKPFTIAQLTTLVREVFGPPALRPTVLVADGDPEVRRLFDNVLSNECGVVLAPNGPEALERLRRTPRVDVMIVEVPTPHEGALATIRAAHELRPALSIVVMSDAFGEPFLNDADTLGIVASLHKPVAVHELRALVRRLCAMADAEARLATSD